jgi:hypothetical protein
MEISGTKRQATDHRQAATTAAATGLARVLLTMAAAPGRVLSAEMTPRVIFAETRPRATARATSTETKLNPTAHIARRATPPQVTAGSRSYATKLMATARNRRVNRTLRTRCPKPRVIRLRRNPHFFRPSRSSGVADNHLQ